MIKKEYRLPSYAFKKIYQKGQSERGEAFILKKLLTQRLFSRFGVVISTKVNKKATQRNLLRRRIFAIIFDLNDKIKPGFDYIVTVKKELDFKEAEKEIRKLFHV